MAILRTELLRSGRLGDVLACLMKGLVMTVGWYKSSYSTNEDSY
ncbi:hypothetical protein [Streptomyces sp. NPDC058486]